MLHATVIIGNYLFDDFLVHMSVIYDTLHLLAGCLLKLQEIRLLVNQLYRFVEIVMTALDKLQLDLDDV